MASGKNTSVYERVVEVTHIYLGPAADRFIDRQVQSHVHKDPSKLTLQDLELLIDWIQVAVALLTDDSEIVEEYIIQLHKIVHPEVKGAPHNE
ncbi:MAG TPA: hypothetical protein VN031_00275 [Candidatus Microsaccharimonas sp.]|nr:hypothetical protein [Candidatus Microsaccharimonas sp.]